MDHLSSLSGTTEFLDAAQESGSILSGWVRKSGVAHKTILAELNKLYPNLGEIGEKSFKQWTSEGESARRVSGNTPELRGDRLTAIVEWFIREHSHRAMKVLTTSELRRLVTLYPDIPVKNRLQLKRLLHDLEIQEGKREKNFSFAKDWKKHFSNWPAFCFVVDEYWCIRASTSYEMALAGYSEEDMKYWGWWHRLTASRGGNPKYSPQSLRYSLRGPYSEAYYQIQLNEFYRETEEFRQNQDKRYLAMMELLQGTHRFNEMWKSSLEKIDSYQQPFGLPVPFFRQDGTLLWMLELSTLIPNTANYRLISWMPLNEDSAEYQGEIRRQIDHSGTYSRRAYFIEDFTSYFSEKQKYAFGLDK